MFRAAFALEQAAHLEISWDELPGVTLPQRGAAP